MEAAPPGSLAGR